MPTDDQVPTAPRGPQLPDHQNRIADLLGGMSNIANSIAEAGGVASSFPFIGINNDGIWAYGPDRTEVEEGSHWAIDIRTWQHGYIAWPDQKAKERKPLGERMVPASHPLPVLATLPDVGQPYQLQFSFELLCMSGEDTGTMALYKNGSYGAKVIVQDMVEKVRAQARLDPTRLCPVVVLDIRSYFHQEWKKTIYNPVLQIQKWISFEEYDDANKTAPSGPALEGGAEEKVVAPQPEPEVAQAAARGNGRRAAAAEATAEVPWEEPKPAPARAAAAPVPQPVPTRRRQPGARA